MQYVGNAVEHGVSVPMATATDFVNNVQMVIVDDPPVGSWTIELRTEFVQTDDGSRRQGFAVAVSGAIG